MAKKKITAFSRWLESSPMAVAEVATELEVSVSSVHGIKDGQFPPGLKLAIRIEKLTEGEILASSWVED